MPEHTDQQNIRFDGQVAIVTGAGRGLGAAYARLLAARGASVVVHDAGVAQDGSGFDPAIADGVVQQIAAENGVAAACHENLETTEACRRIVEFAVDRFGRLDALIHNAGLVIFASLDETRSEVWDRMVISECRRLSISFAPQYPICGVKSMAASCLPPRAVPCAYRTACLV